MARFFENPVELLIVGAVFGLVLALWLGLLCLWHMRRTAQTHKVDQRLGLADSEAGDGRVLRLWHEGKEFTTTVSGVISPETSASPRPQFALISASSKSLVRGFKEKTTPEIVAST